VVVGDNTNNGLTINLTLNGVKLLTISRQLSDEYRDTSAVGMTAI
jgi:hypothetical protein